MSYICKYWMLFLITSCGCECECMHLQLTQWLRLSQRKQSETKLCIWKNQNRIIINKSTERISGFFVDSLYFWAAYEPFVGWFWTGLSHTNDFPHRIVSLFFFSFFFLFFLRTDYHHLTWIKRNKNWKKQQQ